MHASRTDDEPFREAERRAEQGLYRDYREAGEALRQIRDEHQEQWRPQYRTWTRYCEERLGICRQTANYMIQAAEVASDLASRDDAPRLPVRHAALLHRFKDTEVRVRIAIAIQHLTFKQAVRFVIDAADKLKPPGDIRPPRLRRADQRSLPLARFHAILQGCAALDTAALAEAASKLGQKRRKAFAREAMAASRRLREASARLEP